MAPQAGLAQVTSVGAVVFQAERRWRVLLRDIFRFGTATVLSYVGWCWLLVFGLGLGQLRQRRPPRIHRLVVRMVGVVREPGPALGAQSGTVVLAQRLERQCEHHRIPQQGLQVDQVVLQRADLELLIRIDAPVVVNVAGPWSFVLNRMAGSNGFVRTKTFDAPPE